MRLRYLALPFFAVVACAEPPRQAVRIEPPSTGLTIAHLPQGSLVLSIETSPTDDIIAVGTSGHAVQL